MRNTSHLWILGGGAAIAVGSFIPWATAGFLSVSGIDGGDGWITLGLAALLVLVGLRVAAADGHVTSGARLVGWLVALATAAVAFVDLQNISDVVSETAIGVSYGPGLFVILFGSVLALAGASQRTTPAAAGDSADVGGGWRQGREWRS